MFFFSILLLNSLLNCNLCFVPIFNVSLGEFHFVLLISLWLGSPGFTGLLVSSGLPANLQFLYVFYDLVLYYILAK